MSDDGGRDEGDVARSHFQDHLELVEDEVTTTAMVEFPEDCDDAKAVGQVLEVAMRFAGRARSKVGGGGGKREAFPDDVEDHVRKKFVQLGAGVEVEELGGKSSERVCSNKVLERGYNVAQTAR